MFELFLLITISLITGRLLHKRYKVASIAHAVLFVLLFVMFMATTDIAYIKEFMISWMGKVYYTSLNEALSVPVQVLNGGISTILVVELAVFIFFPLLSVVALIKEFKEQFKELKLQKADLSTFFKSLIILVFNPFKDFKHTQNETYLILGRLLN